MNSVFFRRVFHRGLIVLPLIMFLTFSVSGAAAAFKNIKVGDQALPVKLEDLEGQEHSLAKYRESKAILLFFWATWSQRSLTELADLKKFNAEYGDKGLQILAVNVENQAMDDEDLKQIRKVLEENEIDYPILIDKGLTTYNEWGVIATPTTAIISSDGVVTFDLSSYPSSAYLDMEQGIQKALGLYVEEEAEASVEPSYVPNRTALLHAGMGKRHAEKGFMTKALPELEKAAVADSGWAEPHMYMGFVHFRMGDSEKAGASLEKAAQLDPQRLEITWLRAWLLASEEKVDDAIALLQGGEPVEPQGGEPVEPQADEPLDLSEVIALKDAGKQDEAAKALEELLAGKLSEAGFTMKKKEKMSAMEKMQLMMQKKQGQ